LDRFDLLDLWELLEGQLGNTGDDDDVDDDDDDDVPAPKSKKRAPAPVDEDDDDEEEVEAEDEDEDGSDTYTRDDLEGMGLRELKRVAKELGWEASDLKGLDADAIIDTIMGEDGADDEDDDDDEEGLTEDDI